MIEHSTVEALFAKEYRRLVRALGVAFDPESAADAVQEAFLIADRRWSTVGRYQDPAGWVRRVALNRLLTGKRNRKRRREILETIVVPRSDDHTDDYVDLRRAVDQLPRQMRLAVCLHYLADLTVDEVAETLEVSPGTVKSNLHDARRSLRTALEVKP